VGQNRLQLDHHQFRRDEDFMLSNLKEVIDLGGDWLKNNVRDFFWVIRSPRSFFLSRDLDSDPPLIEAAIFATFVSLLDLIISLPIYRQTGLQAENTSYLLVDTVLNVGYALICGSALHAVAVIFRGRGSYQATLVCYLYLTAFTPLTTLVSAPTQTLIARRTVASGDNVISVAFYLDFMREISRSPVAAIGLGFSLLVFAYRFLCTITAVRMVHQTGRLRAFMIAGVGFGVILALTAFLGITMIQNFWQAFRDTTAK
jgi:Yip1-like protein